MKFHNLQTFLELGHLLTRCNLIDPSVFCKVFPLFLYPLVVHLFYSFKSLFFALVLRAE
jgi:hypothetical protein